MFQRMVIAFFFIFAFTLCAQSTAPSVTIRGELSRKDGGRFDMFWVELTLNGRQVDRSAVMTDGAFEFRSVPRGQYELRVTNFYGEIIRRQFIYVHDNPDWLAVELPQRDAATRPADAISVRRLQQQVPSKARNELFRSQKDFEKGEMESSIKHLRKAIDTFPEYMEAHNNLGVRYMRLGDFERAIAAFQKASELDPDAVLANTNLALAFIALKRYDEAEPRARRALATDPRYLQARYALGLIAAARNDCTAEALDNVKGAVKQYPLARVAVARLLACRGDLRQAAAELRAFLVSDGVENRSALEAWLQQLEK